MTDGVEAISVREMASVASCAIRDGESDQIREPLVSFLNFFSAFFSFGVLVGFFLVSFLVSVPLLIAFSPYDPISIEIPQANRLGSLRGPALPINQTSFPQL